MALRNRTKRKRSDKQTDIPVGSFSDIAFLLIVYFLIATSLVKVKSITTDLPTGEVQSEAQIDKTPIINLRGSEIFLSDEPTTMPELNLQLAEMDLPNQQPSKRVIMLESTNETPYEIYYQALAAISTHGGVVALVEEDE